MRGDVNFVRNPTLHLCKLTYQQGVKQLIYVEMISSDLKGCKVCVVVSLAPYQASCEILFTSHNEVNVGLLVVSVHWTAHITFSVVVPSVLFFYFHYLKLFYFFYLPQVHRP